MGTTVADLRNQIRDSAGRFERETATQFTKEELARIADKVGYAVDIGQPPTKPKMRAGIRWKTGISPTEDDAETKPFTKDELRTIADVLDA